GTWPIGKDADIAAYSYGAPSILILKPLGCTTRSACRAAQPSPVLELRSRRDCRYVARERDRFCLGGDCAPCCGNRSLERVPDGLVAQARLAWRAWNHG